MPLCKLCGEDRKLIKAHIIPRAFYEPGVGGLAMMFDRDDVHPKRRPVGTRSGPGPLYGGCVRGSCSGWFMLPEV